MRGPYKKGAIPHQHPDAIEIPDIHPSIVDYSERGYRPADRSKHMTRDLYKRSELLYGYSISAEEHKEIVARELEMFERFHHDDVPPLAKLPKRQETTHDKS